ncbi:dual specificity protein phosphatase 22 isoform X2 [Pseudonaja textilis]|uniref:dual specificity protein phosphatase 22 isoform X2 n=1 Tax=Pseudonaja textilis TaxID=8673 RepID=UPI000EA9A310|nr:dual specificity protein phosphatase 22 isoform X2 [Pseudonaja textilis]
MGNGMNKILPGLFLGNDKDARDTEQLKQNNITHILSIHDSARPMLEGIKYLCIPAADSPTQNLLAGVSRSATLVVAYIMTITDFGWEDALSIVRVSRSYASPNMGFQQQLEDFEKKEMAQFRDWLKAKYGENPLEDKKDAEALLQKHRLQAVDPYKSVWKAMK